MMPSLILIFITEISGLRIAHPSLTKELRTSKPKTDCEKKGLPAYKCLSCGYRTDCPRDYEIGHVIQMAREQRVRNETVEMKLTELHDKAREVCRNATGTLVDQHGGWCYERKAQAGKNRADLDQVRAGKDSDVDYYLPRFHIQADPVFVKALVHHKILFKEDGSCCASLTDLGAGVGQFGHALRAFLPNLEYYGYDGAGNVEEFTNNYVQWADLTQPLNLKRTDWVISSEVGEHIPHEFEKQMIANIHAHNCRGVILTWAVLGQGGHGHVNCHSNSYLIDIFEKLGYKLNTTLSAALKASWSTSKWYRNSAMAFDRIDRTAAECNI